MAGPHSSIANTGATCCVHTLLWACPQWDTVRQCELLRDTLDICSEISKLLKL